VEKQAQRMEELLEKSMDTVTSHPAFLNAVSTMLNVNSYRKIWFRRTMEALWKDLELPVRREQEKLLSHIEELSVRIKKLELDLQIEREKSARPVAGTPKVRASKVKSPSTAELEFQ
jgi:polyhydroxyalkanoate synthesis regulator phasin